jgi:hypothetical protein
MWTDFAAEERGRFRRAMPNARVVELVGARHAVYISNTEDVLREIRAFRRHAAPR